MQNDEHSDRIFADEVCARLDLVEPSAALLRRVASIPLEQAAQSTGTLSQLWSPWPTRLLLVGALACGASLGTIPLEVGEISSELPMETAADDGPVKDDDGEFEDALALALGTAWTRPDVLPGESH
jgi:hypothetical protein